MKYALVLLATLAASPVLAQATTETKSFWDRDGSFAGSSATHGNEGTTSYSDRDGRFSGSSIRNSDGTTSLYDARGHFTGSVTNTTQQHQQRGR
jgi:hypothetical protein